jgi:alkyl sulfatase BDS1-like metallo-beta-lactamase superfamily hydrolase
MPLIQNSLIQQQQQQQEDMDQTVSMQQQAMQRELINGLQAQALSPGTQFQMQGLEQTIDPSTLMANMADPYGYGRGII